MDSGRKIAQLPENLKSARGRVILGELLALLAPLAFLLQMMSKLKLLRHADVGCRRAGVSGIAAVNRVRGTGSARAEH